MPLSPDTVADLDRLRRCRMCTTRLTPVLDLGRLAVSTFPLVGEAAPPLRAPLVLCVCDACGLVQLQHTVQPDLLYKERYWYRSGVNEVMQAELADVARSAIERVRLEKGDLLVDVGANDGTLLAEYPKYPAARRAPRIAFEPARNLYDRLRPRTELLIHDYFPDGLSNLTDIKRQVKILTSIAMFYDVDAPIPFVQAVDAVLHPEGVWVVQFQDLATMLEAMAFDNICHEHLVYYSVASFARLLEGVDLAVAEVERRAINGGSVRIYVTRKARAVEVAGPSPEPSWDDLERFAWRVSEVRQQITAAVGGVVDAGGTVDLYAASTKANTLLQVCGLGSETLRQAWERSPEKVGRTTVTGIPIVSEEEGRRLPPTALLLGAWQHKAVFIERERTYLDGGGTMIVPLPEVDFVRLAKA